MQKVCKKTPFIYIIFHPPYFVNRLKSFNSHPLTFQDSTIEKTFDACFGKHRIYNKSFQQIPHQTLKRQKIRLTHVFSSLTRLSSSKLAEKYGFSAFTWFAKILTSSLNESDEQTSLPGLPESRGVHVESSHFSNTSASSGNRG